MPNYVDGFMLPVPKRNLAVYRRMARKAGKIWCEYGALEFRECVGDDLMVNGTALFPQAAKAKPGETVMFSWIVFKSKADRNRINAKVMKDPRLADMMDIKSLPFDSARMAYGGFKVLVSL
jgi:uncharacterized protein YbaA (DUF1428 family)